MANCYPRTATSVAARRLGDKVHLLGHVRGADLPSHIEACDVFCMPSTVRAEAYGVAMVEAMIMGKPIVATDIAGLGRSLGQPARSHRAQRAGT